MQGYVSRGDSTTMPLQWIAELETPPRRTASKRKRIIFCYRCSKPGHVAKYCQSRLTVVERLRRRRRRHRFWWQTLTLGLKVSLMTVCLIPTKCNCWYQLGPQIWSWSDLYFVCLFFCLSLVILLYNLYLLIFVPIWATSLNEHLLFW